jgi:hypothetical protein
MCKPVRMPIKRHDPEVLRRVQRWEDEVTNRLPVLLTELLESPVFGLAAGRELPPKAYGVYLLTDRGRPCYVGRVGLTDRSRRAGKQFSNFQTRLKGHAVARHESGTYAYARTVRTLQRNGVELLGTRRENCADPDFMDEFRRQCERVRRMGCQVVEITDNRLSAVFEIYAAAARGLRNQTFAVS